MLLAGDIGGTKTLLGLFAAAPERPTPVEIGEFITLDYDGLEPMIREFLFRRRRRGHRAGRAADQRAVAR
jgi:glucokinase